jgi:hypothetical protein
MTTEPVSVNLGEFLAWRLLKKLEAQPLTVTLHLSGGSVEMEVPPTHPWFKELTQRRTEQVQRLRESFKTKSEGVQTNEGTA